jgi:hypothetical protein
MAKRKPTPLATALLAVDALSPEETLTLVDYLKSKTAVPRKKPEKKKKDAPPTLVLQPICGICGHEEGYTDHFQPSPNYHAFESGKKKASAA